MAIASRVLAALLLGASGAAQTPDVALHLPSGLQSRPSAGCRIAAPAGALGGSAARLLASQRTWPGGVVPFVYDAAVTPAMQAAMALAMQEISARVRVQFVPRGSEADWVLIRDANINSSPIGRQGGPQQLLIANWNLRFEMAHALMHLLGFWHEHQRPDRDTFIAVQAGNVDPARSIDFQLVPLGETYGLPYDFDSVLHFADTEGSVGGAQTILVLPPNQGQQGAIGQRTHLSAGDVEALRRTYGSLVPPTIAQLTPSSVPSYLMPPVLIDGQLMDEVTRVLLGGTQVSFQRVSPTQLRILGIANRPIGPTAVVVESGAGPSAAATLQVLGTEPPVFEGPPVLNPSVAFPFRLHADATRANVLFAALDNVPSSLPGIVSLGLGSQFTTLFEVARGSGDATGTWTVSLLGPRGLPAGTSIWLQAVVFDPATFAVPFSTSNVLTVRAF